MERSRPQPASPLNLDWITPTLAVGGRFEREHCEHLARVVGVNAVVDLRLEACDDEVELRRCGLRWLHLPTEDFGAIARERLEHGVAWVNERLDAGERVYVHCEHGVGRSATLALCVLVSRGHAPLDALASAKRARWQVSPSPAQLEAYLAWSEEVRRRTCAEWRLPTFDELAAIAYSHLRRS